MLDQEIEKEMINQEIEKGDDKSRDGENDKDGLDNYTPRTFLIVN